MPKAKGLDWEQLIKENPGLSEQLDKLFERKGPSDCWNYIRQRKRQPKLTHRGRVSFRYKGKRYTIYAYRLVFVREHGRIADNIDVAHICEGNGYCGNPSHLAAMSPETHRKFDASMRKWVDGIKKMCPTAKGHHGTAPQGWMTNRKHKKGTQKKRTQKRIFVKAASD